MVGYLGVIGQQEGIEYLLEAARYIKEDLKSDDIFWGCLLYTSDVYKRQQLIHNVYDMDFELKNEVERSNRLLFEQCFSLEIFAKNYIQLINSI